MDGENPRGGEWNYDDENREALPEDIDVPALTYFEPDDITLEVMEMVEELFSEHFGELKKIRYAVNRKQALNLLKSVLICLGLMKMRWPPEWISSFIQISRCTLTMAC